MRAVHLKNGRSPAQWLSILMETVLLVGTAALADASTLYVGNDGFDSSTCGAKTSPCRSIGNAIAIASAGDRIVVGPGRYGDLDGNGSLGSSPGEEVQAPGCFCMIDVNKSLTLESSAGAGVTVLDGGSILATGVVIRADAVVFGKKKKGFTITGVDDALEIYSSTTGVKVAGNTIAGNSGEGFFCMGTGHTLADNVGSGNGGEGFQVFGTGHTISGNVAAGNLAEGFVLSGTGYTVKGNAAIGNRGDGFYLSGGGHSFNHNVATGNSSDGIDFDTDNSVYKGNVVSGNGHWGFHVGCCGNLIRNNAVVGNGWDGIETHSASNTITRNNIFANDRLAGGTNCGLKNVSGTSIAAPKNFWGAGSGPGPDPADYVCGSPVAVAPVAKKKISISVSAGR